MTRCAVQHEVFLCRHSRQSCFARPQNFTRTMQGVVPKLQKKRRSVRSLNRCAIQYEVSVCALHLPKHSHLVSATVDETFRLLAALVSAHRRAQPLLRNHSAALPEKDSLYQSFRQAFFKRPRILTSPVRNQNYEKNKSWIYIARMSEESDRHRGHAQRACRCRL